VRVVRFLLDSLTQRGAPESTLTHLLPLPSFRYCLTVKIKKKFTEEISLVLRLILTQDVILLSTSFLVSFYIPFSAFSHSPFMLSTFSFLPFLVPVYIRYAFRPHPFYVPFSFHSHSIYHPIRIFISFSIHSLFIFFLPCYRTFLSIFLLLSNIYRSILSLHISFLRPLLFDFRILFANQIQAYNYFPEGQEARLIVNRIT
jgi:hypothetical protein